MEEALNQHDTEVFTVFDHEESAIGSDVITLMAGKIDRVWPIEKFDGCRYINLRSENDAGCHDFAPLTEVQLATVRSPDWGQTTVD